MILLAAPLTCPLLFRLTTVPGGTGISYGGVKAFFTSLLRLGPALPTAGLPLAPRGALYSLRLCRCSRLSHMGSHTNTTSAPSAPSAGLPAVHGVRVWVACFVNVPGYTMQQNHNQLPGVLNKQCQEWFDAKLQLLFGTARLLSWRPQPTLQQD